MKVLKSFVLIIIIATIIYSIIYILFYYLFNFSTKTTFNFILCCLCSSLLIDIYKINYKKQR